LHAEIHNLFCSSSGIDADGMSVVFASKFFSSKKLKEKVVTTDFFLNLAELSKLYPIKFYLIGGTSIEIKLAIDKVKKKYEHINIIGYTDGYFKNHEIQKIINEINFLKPDIIFVGLGVPKEQEFVKQILPHIRGVCWIKTCGGMFRVLSGFVKRPPKWVQSIGMEWAYRCIKEPRHVFFRYLTTNFIAIAAYIIKSR
jgi:exopolysaccharide biosynthesis WecB/TagA/CpsF family protein